MWIIYNHLDLDKYNYYTVNHSIHFVDTDTDVQSNTLLIELGMGLSQISNQKID